MDRDRWRRIEAHFNYALTLPAGRRAAWLEGLDEDAAFVMLVREMLRADRRNDIDADGRNLPTRDRPS